jgi:hypothetical protein
VGHFLVIVHRKNPEMNHSENSTKGDDMKKQRHRRANIVTLDIKEAPKSQPRTSHVEVVEAPAQEHTIDAEIVKAPTQPRTIDVEIVKAPTQKLDNEP